MTQTLKIALSVLAVSLASAVNVQAQDCGGAQNPCELENGSYHMAVPSTAKASGLVMHLHGGGGTGRGLLTSGLTREASVRGYVFIAPNGEHPENRWTKDWSVRADGMSFARDDMSFLKEVLVDARQRTALPDAPVLLAGFSRGGSMVWNVACYDPDFADAYAPMAGAFWNSLPAECDGPVHLFHTHGWADRTVPLEGRSFGAIVQGDVWHLFPFYAK